MKILTIRRIVGFTAIAAAYAHGKRGGNLTLASIADTLNYLWSSVSERLGLAQHPQSPIPERTASPSSSTGSSAANGPTSDRTRRTSNG